MGVTGSNPVLPTKSHRALNDNPQNISNGKILVKPRGYALDVTSIWNCRSYGLEKNAFGVIGSTSVVETEGMGSSPISVQSNGC